MAHTEFDTDLPDDRVGKGQIALAAFVAAVLLVGMIAVGLSTPGGGSGAQRVASEVPSAFDSADADALAAALNARDPGRLASVLKDPEVAEDPTVAASIVREGESLTILAETFDSDGEVGDAQVEARIVGPEPATMTLFLVEVAGQWKIAGSTAPVPVVSS